MPAVGWAARQRQNMVVQETSTVSRTRSTVFPGPDNHLPARRYRDKGRRLTRPTFHTLLGWC
jgi:hypothetical protein